MFADCAPLVGRVQKKEAEPGEKPEPVRTHLRNMIIVPEMIGSIIGVYNGKTFNQVEIKVRQGAGTHYLHWAGRSQVQVHSDPIARTHGSNGFDLLILRAWFNLGVRTLAHSKAGSGFILIRVG